MISERARWECPGCSRAFSVPALAVAKMKFCPECKKSSEESAIQKSPETPEPNFNFEDNNDNEDDSPPNTPLPTLARTKITEDIPPTSRYPNLELHLKWIEKLAHFQFSLAIIAGILVAIWVLFTGFGRLIEFGDFQSGAAGIVCAIVFPIIIIVPAWVAFIISMSFTEFVRVIMDIELNTRLGLSRDNGELK